MKNLIERSVMLSVLAGMLLFTACNSSENKENTTTETTATENTAPDATATENTADQTATGNSTANASTPTASAADLEKAKQLYNTNCAVCHKLNNEVLIGPGLAGINQKHPQEWLVKWIKNSQKVIESGDKYAVELFNKYNKVPMPAYENFSDDEIKAILAYIEQNQEK
ncbi:cytochrome c [Rhodocytophaga aerolata]|uniref:Cytochrome c n=1 Tax=Rhodocytophaga aerolata TaxID=455078 RepID=A0ABT8R796_9BACT|nr:cytochrome c [Rhodocytophaga aerolata]MDO1447980.1 cytochrome c [Rhodocytophaga aerolata]